MSWCYGISYHRFSRSDNVCSCFLVQANCLAPIDFTHGNLCYGLAPKPTLFEWWHPQYINMPKSAALTPVIVDPLCREMEVWTPQTNRRRVDADRPRFSKRTLFKGLRFWSSVSTDPESALIMYSFSHLIDSSKKNSLRFVCFDYFASTCMPPWNTVTYLFILTNSLSDVEG